jgi:hypothetical protein
MIASCGFLREATIPTSCGFLGEAIRTLPELGCLAGLGVYTWDHIIGFGRTEGFSDFGH